MWKSSIRGIIVDRIRFSFSKKPGTDAEQIFDRVFTILDELAWFHRVPVLMLASATTIFCFVRHGKGLDKLDPDIRQNLIGSASRLPFWRLFHKLIGSITLLNYFDDHVVPGNTRVGRLRP